MHFHYKPRERARNSFVLVTEIAINYGYSQWRSCAIGMVREQMNKEMQENVYDHVHGHHFDHQKGATFICQKN